MSLGATPVISFRMRFISFSFACLGVGANDCPVTRSGATSSFACTTKNMKATMTALSASFEFDEKKSITLHATEPSIGFFLGVVQLKTEEDDDDENFALERMTGFEWKGIAGEGRIGFDHSLVYLLTRMRSRFRKNFDASDIHLAHSEADDFGRTLTCLDENTVIAEFKAPREFFEEKFALNNGDTPAELLIMNAICNKALDWIVAINPRSDRPYEVGANKLCMFQYENTGYSGQVSLVDIPACYDKKNVPTRSILPVFSFLPKVVTENGLVTITCDKEEVVKYIAVAGSEADPSAQRENSYTRAEMATLKRFCRVILRMAKITKQMEQVKFSKLLDGIQVADTERQWEITNSALSETAGLPSPLPTALFTVTTKQPPSTTFLSFGRSCQFRHESPATSSVCWKDYARNMEKPQVDCSFNLASVSFEGPSPVSISHPVLLGNNAGKPYLVFPC